MKMSGIDAEKEENIYERVTNKKASLKLALLYDCINARKFGLFVEVLGAANSLMWQP